MHLDSLKILEIFNKNFSIKSFFKRFFVAIFLLVILIFLISTLIILNLFSFLAISEKYSTAIYEIIIRSFSRWRIKIVSKDFKVQ